MMGTTVDKFWTYLDSTGLAHVYNSAFESGSARQTFLIAEEPADWIGKMPVGRLSNSDVMKMREARDGWANNVVTKETVTAEKGTQRTHYHVEIAPGVWVDVYDVLQAWGVTNPAYQHLIKKALKPGNRGHKDMVTDAQDIIDSAVRGKELIEKVGDS